MKSQTTGRILWYLGLTFLLTWGYEFLVVYPIALGDNPMLKPLASLFIAPAMFVPALCVLFTRLITKEGFQNAWIAPHFKGSIRYYLLAWFAPTVWTLVGMAVYFLIWPGKFDADVTLLREMTAAAGQSMSAEQARGILAAQFAVGVLMAPLLNALPCFGEEWGWRGYLLPKMQEKLPMGWLLLVNGFIWGVWHAPITAIGHNYGTGYPGWPVTGILAMCVFCTALGAFFTWVTLKTGSILPAVFAHAGLNGVAAIGAYLTIDANPFVGPTPTGIVGGIGLIITGIVSAVLLIREETRKKRYIPTETL